MSARTGAGTGSRPRVVVYHNLDRGGALRATLELINATAEYFDYDVVTLRVGPEDRDAEEIHRAALPNIQRLHVVSDRSWLNQRLSSSRTLAPVGAFRAVRSLEVDAARWINANRYDLAIVHPCRITQTPLLFGELVAPRAYYMHEPRRRSFERNYNVTPSRPGWTGLARRLGQPVLERALRRRDEQAASAPGLVLCNSYFTKEAIFRSYGINAEVCYLGVDVETFSPAGEGLTSPPFVVSVGGLEPAKGHEFVIDSVAAMPTGRRPQVRVVYDRELPGYRDRLARRADEEGVRLRFHSGISDAELAAIYRGAVATVCAARLEPFGLTTLESLSCGTPVVAVREGGFREVVQHQLDGYLVDRHPASAADALEKVMDGQLPGDHLSRFRRTQESWSWSAAGDRFMTHVSQLLPPARRPLLRP